MKTLVEKLCREHSLTRQEYLRLLHEAPDDLLFLAAQAQAQASFGRGVFIRGLVEISSYCRNDCLYCGIRRSNHRAQRYRLTAQEILSCCREGYALGFRTFVLQGGEDKFFTTEILCKLVADIKLACPECAVTLSMGEMPAADYRALRGAGADRYLLRHETATASHYARLHPPQLTLENRLRCLHSLKEIGFQTGCGFMVGSPGQTVEHLADELVFLQGFQPHMVGIGPFLPHCDTPFADQPPGALDTTLRLLAIIRLLLPQTLLPATTALATLHPRGRILGIQAGANVVMPNLSPAGVRGKYNLYNGKAITGSEAAENLAALESELSTIGYHIAYSRGDYPT